MSARQTQRTGDTMKEKIGHPIKKINIRNPLKIVWLLLLYILIIGTVQAQNLYIAYQIPTNSVGNQAFDGALGMEFDVINPIIITRLGAFDDGGDGMNRTITVRLYDRSDEANPVEMAMITFSPEDPGVLVDGSRFKPLSKSISLPLGFKGTIVAENYGAEERLRNGGFTDGRNWVLNDGSGSIQFVGTSRYGVTQGAYPDVVDVGPADRYGAGTFEFQSTAPLKPGKPAGITITAGDGTIHLRWQAVTNPLVAAKYQIYRALGTDGASNQVAEVTQTEYLDKGLINGQVYAFYIRGVGPNGSLGDFTSRLGAAPYVLKTNEVVAYFVPSSLAGNQNFSGVLGMEFNVLNPIIITKLGVFDDGSDGMKRTITAKIFDRSDPANPIEMVSLDFTTEAPGALIGSTRYKDLSQPLQLGIGFQGTITAENYGAEERLLNSNGSTNAIVWSMNDGNGSLSFVGRSRYGTTPGGYSDVADGGPAARYAAGSFVYQTTPPQAPGVPTVTVSLADRAIKLSWNSVEKPLPATSYRIYTVTEDGQTNKVAEVTNTEFTHGNLTKGTVKTYIVRAVSASGKESMDSNTISMTVEARESGIAYQVEGNTLGTQAFGGALGMDFDLVVPIKITKLGVFDDSSDGLGLTIKARIFDRSTGKELTLLEFTPENPGELVGGSRFKDLSQALVLPAGFQGTIAASGYGAGERLGNNVAGRSVFGAAGAIRFVGTSRYGTDPDKFPNTPDAGPFNRYAAGTFFFEPMAEQPKLTISIASGKVTINWTGGGTLEKASQLIGPWNSVTGATSGYQTPASETSAFYRVKM